MTHCFSNGTGTNGNGGVIESMRDPGSVADHSDPARRRPYPPGPPAQLANAATVVDNTCRQVGPPA